MYVSRHQDLGCMRRKVQPEKMRVHFPNGKRIKTKVSFLEACLLNIYLSTNKLVKSPIGTKSC